MGHIKIIPMLGNRKVKVVNDLTHEYKEKFIESGKEYAYSVPTGKDGKFIEVKITIEEMPEHE